MIPQLEIKYAGKTAIIFGSSGLVGKYCLRKLLEMEAYDKVISFNRELLDMEHPKLSQYQANAETLDQVSKSINGNDLYLCIGTTLAKAKTREYYRDINFKYAFRIAKHARMNGVGQLILVSSIGANPSSSIYHSQVKGELEKSVRKLGFWSTHIFQPSVLLGYREESRIKEELLSVAMEGLRFIFKGRFAKYEPVEVQKIAKAMIDVAQIVKKGVHTYHADDILKMYEERSLISRK